MKHMTATSAQVTPETDVLKFNLQLFADDPPADVTPPEGGEPPAGNPPETPPEGTPPTDSPEGTEPPTEGAPEEYADFTVPEGLTYDKETAGDFLATAKELNLTQEQAQKLVDVYGNRLLEQQEAQQKQSADWAAESKKQFKKADIELANKTLGKFADKEVIELLANTGLGNHKAVIGLFNKIGKQMSEGQFIESPSNSPAKSAAEILYPSMVKK